MATALQSDPAEASMAYALLLEYLNAEVVKALLYPALEPGAEPSLLAAAVSRIDAIGFDAGMRACERLSTKAPPLPGPVEKIRFICFDFWKAAFNKHADKLRTRQKVVFFLTDSDFPWLRAMSSTSERDASQYARHYVTMVLGFIRGALHTLGMPSRVDIESIQGSDCTFTIELL